MTMTVEEALAEAEYRKMRNPFATVRQEAVLVLVDELRRLRDENATLRAQRDEQRDEHAQNSANATTQCIAYQPEIALLLNLLAVIHRDGGQYTERFGVLQSTKEAEAAICRERVECSELREQLAQERKRLDTVAYYGAALRRDPNDGKWYVIVPFHSGISSVDSLIRFDTTREAIDNLVAAEAAGGGK